MRWNAVGFDPGGNIGVAKLRRNDSGQLEFAAMEFKDPVVAWIWASDGDVDAYVVEDFVGAGPRSSIGTYTTKQVGAFEMAARLAHTPVEVVQPSLRRRWLSWAYASLGYARALEHDPERVSALAHARGLLERRSNGSKKVKS